MKLCYTEAQRRFRATAREWLQQHDMPGDPLPSFDTREGFEQHRRWESTLYQGGWSEASARPETLSGPGGR